MQPQAWQPRNHNGARHVAQHILFCFVDCFRFVGRLPALVSPCSSSLTAIRQGKRSDKCDSGKLVQFFEALEIPTRERGSFVLIRHFPTNLLYSLSLGPPPSPGKASSSVRANQCLEIVLLNRPFGPATESVLHCGHWRIRLLPPGVFGCLMREGGHVHFPFFTRNFSPNLHPCSGPGLPPRCVSLSPLDAVTLSGILDSKQHEIRRFSKH